VKVSGAPGGDLLLRADTILIATGSSPVHPPAFPFGDDRVHDSDEILTLERLPKSLAVVGAGVIGSEYACTFAALGVEVHLLDGRDELLPFLDRDVSNALHQAMERLGIAFHWNEKVVSCGLDTPGKTELICESGKRLVLDGVLVAAGRRSNVEELNLPAAGIAPGERGLIGVDSCFRTSVPHIYAVGDVIGFPALAATSAEQGRVAMSYACGQEAYAVAAPLLPTGIYTIPEVSMVGDTEEALKKKSIEYVVGHAKASENARGMIIGDQDGFLKLLFRREDMKLLGAHVIGEHASEVIHIALITMVAGQGAGLLFETCFNYPTLGDMYKLATYRAVAVQRRLS
jgi:NAD(P) transhydrogenase